MDPTATFVFVALNALFAYFVCVLPSLMVAHSDWIIYGSACVVFGVGVLQLCCMMCANCVAPSGKFMTKNGGIAHTHVHTYTRTHVHIHIYTHTYTRTQIHTCTHTHIEPLTLPVKLAWWTMEQPSFFIPAISLAMHAQSGRPLPPTAVFLPLFMLHYFQRAFIYPWLTRGRPFPVFPNYVGAVIFTAINGSGQASDLLYGNYAHYGTMADLLQPRVFVGVGMFFFGFAANLHADYVLRNLRKPGDDKRYRVRLKDALAPLPTAHTWSDHIPKVSIIPHTQTAKSGYRIVLEHVLSLSTRTHARTNARANARTHERTNARTHCQTPFPY